jgi:hypothetical protein
VTIPKKELNLTVAAFVSHHDPIMQMMPFNQGCGKLSPSKRNT